jgi:hypothetical protein
MSDDVALRGADMSDDVALTWYRHGGHMADDVALTWC